MPLPPVELSVIALCYDPIPIPEQPSHTGLGLTDTDELQTARKHLPRSLTGEAISYALNQWPKLGMFLRDGRVQVDNNLTENAIRPSAIGKKNWLFMGDPQTGSRAATFYTLIGNCHREGINATAYLTDIFTRLPPSRFKTIAPLLIEIIACHL